jgi:lipopolysaccharide transport system permease protein
VSEIKIEVTTIIKPKGNFSFGLKEIWQYRELLYFFAWKEIKVRYKQAVLGVLWTVLQPLFMMLIFLFLFSKGLQIKTGNIPAPLFYLSGLLVWNFFSSAINNSATAMITHSNIIKKIYFPRIIIPLSQIITGSFDFIISTILLIGIGLYYYNFQNLQISWTLLIYGLTISFLLSFITSFSIGTFLSAINVKYRDVRYVLPFLTQTLFFITPVIYDYRVVHHKYVKFLLDVNPLHHAIQSIRCSFTNNNCSIQIPLHSIILSLLFLTLSIYTFRRTEAYFADII